MEVDTNDDEVTSTTVIHTFTNLTTILQLARLSFLNAANESTRQTGGAIGLEKHQFRENLREVFINVFDSQTEVGIALCGILMAQVDKLLKEAVLLFDDEMAVQLMKIMYNPKVHFGSHKN